MKRSLQLLIRNCAAISGIIGELLMVGIVVLAFGITTVFVLSSLHPSQEQFTDIEGWADVEKDTIYFRHSGGEVVSTEEIRIIVDLNGTRYELSSDNVTAILGSSMWELSDTIVINTSDLWGVTIEDDDYIDASIVHIGFSSMIKTGVIL